MSVPTGAAGPGDADRQAAFAATLADEWARNGVEHAVVCPGSRSTPLVIALAVHPDIAVHVRLDERSAGFSALGIGLATGHPALVVTTSGTAAAELHPAVVEADLGGVPLVACTADRPLELRAVGAPQTIDQTHLFGRAVRWFADPGVAGSAPRSTWRSLAARSVAEATSGPYGPGPVHLNLPFREPLLGDPARGGGVEPGRAGGRAWHTVALGVVGPPGGTVLSTVGPGAMAPGSRGLIVAGAGCGDPESVLALSAAFRWPVLADPRSGVRLDRPGVIATADGILRSERFAAGHPPELVLRLGARWASKIVNSYLSTASANGAQVVVVDPFGRWSDPEHEAGVMVRSDPTSLCHQLTGRAARGEPAVPGAGGSEAWWGAWLDAEAAARAAISGALADSSLALSEPALAHRLFARLSTEATLVVSSSMPIRDVEGFALPRAAPPRVLSNRGANGIDGVVSTALGVAVGSPGPTVALVGDLAFLHDVSALLRAEGSTASLTVVVADNGGGGIFSFLEQASALGPASFDELFGTPQAPDPASVAAGFGWPVDEVGGTNGSSELEEVLDRRVRSGTASVIRVRLPGRAGNVAIHEELNAAIVRAVDRGGDRAQQGRGS